MLVIDKPALTRLARALRAGAAARGVVAAHSVFLEAAATALGFRDVNAATAHLKQRAIVVGIPASPDWPAGLALEPPSDLKVATQVVRLLHAGPIATDGSREEVTDDVLYHLRNIGIDTFTNTPIEDRIIALQIWLSDHPMPDTTWAGQETLEFAEQVGEAGCELQRLQALSTTLAVLEPGSMVVPDAVLSFRSMGAAAGGRVHARTGGHQVLSAAFWEHIFESAFFHAVMSPETPRGPQAEVTAAVVLTIRREGLSLDHPETIVAGSGARWSMVDRVLAEMGVGLRQSLRGVPAQADDTVSRHL